MGITILYEFKGDKKRAENFEINLNVALQQKLLSQDEVLEISTTLSKF